MVIQNDAAHWKLDVPPMTTCFWRSHRIVRISMPSGKHYSLLPASFPNGADQIYNKSIWGPGHTNFLPGAIISMVYLLTRRFLKAEASWGLSYRVAAAHVTALQPLSAPPSLTPLFIWKSLALPNLSGLLTQNQISDLIISSDAITGAKPLYLYIKNNTWWGIYY